jgi:ADP-heptose:LPS heptosyltransferase
MTQRAFPILFITATRIGDAVLSSGLIQMLADQIPNARFTIVAGPLAAPLFAHVPGLDRVIVMEKGKGKGHWFKLWNQVRHKKWSLIVDLRGSGTALFLRREKRAIWKKSLGEPVHKVIDAARVLKLEGAPPAPHLYITPEVQALADQMLAPKKGEIAGPLLAMGPASNWVGKVWPIERFAQTSAQLLGPDGPLAGGRLLILGGPDDSRMVEELRMASARGRCIDLTGKVDLLTAYACLKRADLFIGNDSGLMHIAAAAGTPTIGLFGPSDERRYAPWGRRPGRARTALAGPVPGHRPRPLPGHPPHERPARGDRGQGRQGAAAGRRKAAREAVVGRGRARAEVAVELEAEAEPRPSSRRSFCQRLA